LATLTGLRLWAMTSGIIGKANAAPHMGAFIHSQLLPRFIA
jgi:hypothetical protein